MKEKKEALKTQEQNDLAIKEMFQILDKANLNSSNEILELEKQENLLAHNFDINKSIQAALNNLTESLYFDFGRYNVRVSLVSPGFIKTPMTDKNNFKMPFLKTTEYAANKIYDGLINKNVFEIHFPKELTLIL